MYVYVYISVLYGTAPTKKYVSRILKDTAVGNYETSKSTKAREKKSGEAEASRLYGSASGKSSKIRPAVRRELLRSVSRDISPPTTPTPLTVRVGHELNRFRFSLEKIMRDPSDLLLRSEVTVNGGSRRYLRGFS